MGNEQVRERLQHVGRSELTRHHEREALPRVLIDHRQHLQGAPVRRAVGHEVIRPDVMAMRGPLTDARPIGEPEAPALRLFRWHF